MTRKEQDPGSTTERELQELADLERNQSTWQKKSPASKVMYALVTIAIVGGSLALSKFADSNKDDAQTGQAPAGASASSAQSTNLKSGSCNTATVALDRAMSRISAGDKSDFDGFHQTVDAASEDLLSASGNIRDPEVREVFQDVQGALIGMKVAIELSGDSESTIQYAKDAIESETKELDRQVAALEALCK